MISIVTPSIRPEMLDVVLKCIKRQNFPDYEWVVVGNEAVEEWHEKHFNDQWFPMIFVEEPKKREGDYYNLNKAWNAAFKMCNSPLIVNIVDGLWFPPWTLQLLYAHYQVNPKSCVSCIGHQYDRVENGKPEHLVWSDPRVRADQGSFYEVPHTEMELCIASFPRQAILDVGGVDEEFDKYAALSEKEMMARMYKAGYKTYIDQSIEYRAIKHERLSKEWDARYQAGWPYYEKCMREIEAGTRLRLDFVS